MLNRVASSPSTATRLPPMRRTGRSFRTPRTRSRSHPKTAPAADCASKPVRPGTRPTVAARPSTWCPRRHGDLRYGLEQQKKAVLSGHWPLLHYDPRLAVGGGQPFHLDSKPPSIPLEDYVYSETRYRMLTQSDPVEAKRLLALAQQDVNDRWL